MPRTAKPLEAGGRDDRLEVGELGSEREVVDRRVRQPEASLVVPDDRRERSEPVEEAPPDWAPPVVLEVAEPALCDDQAGDHCRDRVGQPYAVRRRQNLISWSFGPSDPVARPARVSPSSRPSSYGVLDSSPIRASEPARCRIRRRGGRYTRGRSEQEGEVAQAGPARRPGRRRRPTAQLRDVAVIGDRRSAPVRDGRPRPRCGSSRRASCAARTTGRASRSSACSSTSASLEDYPLNTLPNFTDALVALLPTLEDHACSLGRRGGFITRLRDGTWMGHVAEHVALEFQNLAGTDVRHGKTRAAGPRRPVQLHLRVSRGGGRARGRPDGRRARQLPRRAGRPRVLFDFAPETGAAHPARRAAGVRPIDPGTHRRGGQPRHPVLPARPPFARPVRARRPPAADPGDR